MQHRRDEKRSMGKLGPLLLLTVPCSGHCGVFFLVVLGGGLSRVAKVVPGQCRIVVALVHWALIRVCSGN
jgi:hypothetical protein